MDGISGRGLSPSGRHALDLALRGMCIAGALMLIAVLAPRASSRPALLLLAGLGGLVLLTRPEWGLVVLIPAGLVVPFSLGTGTGTEVPISLLLLAALLGIWLLRMAHRREVRLAPSPANAPLLALVGVAGLSIVVGDALWNPFVQTKGNFGLVQLAQWSVFLFSAGAFWLTANLVRDVRWLKWMVAAFLGLGAAYIGLRLAAGGASLAGRLFPPGAASALFWVWLVALAGGQVLFNRRLRPAARLALAGLVAATLAVAWFQGRDWVSGWAPPLAALLLLFWLRSPATGAAVTLGLGLGVQLFYPYFYTNVVLTAVQSGSFLRLDAWRGVWQLVGNRWPLGLGLAAYWHYWRDLIGTWAYSAHNVDTATSVAAHNNYVDLYAQMGMVGVAAFAWLAAALWRQGWRLRRAFGDGFEAGYINGCLAGLVASLAAGMLSDWLLPFVYNVGLAGMRASLLGWLFLGGLVALEQVARGGGDAA